MKHLRTHGLEITACIAGIVVGAAITFTLFVDQPLTDPYDTAYHTHADFVVYVRGERVDFANAAYMTTSEQSLHTDVHLHDDVGDVVHFHAPQVTFSEFLSSLDYTLTNDCLINSAGEQFCSNEDEVLQLFVNDELYVGDISAHVPADLDIILLHYGDATDANIPRYLQEVTNESCIYSGTCPERGIAPSESCGLTCEL